MMKPATEVVVTFGAAVADPTDQYSSDQYTCPKIKLSLVTFSSSCFWKLANVLVEAGMRLV